jgi:hypothetical protein
MVTLAQPDLGADRAILTTVARHNRAEMLGSGRFACLGAYASVDSGGTIRVGDNVADLVQHPGSGTSGFFRRGNRAAVGCSSRQLGTLLG